MNEVNCKLFRQFLIENTPHEVSVFFCDRLFSCVFCLSQVQANHWWWVFLEQSAEVTPGRYRINVLMFFKDYIWLKCDCIRKLWPEKRDWTSNLNKRAHHWRIFIVYGEMTVDYLFYFYKIGWTTFLVYTPPQIPCPCIVPTSSSNQKNCKLITGILKVFKINWPVHDRHTPLFSF